MNPPSFNIATEHSAQHLPLFILILNYYKWTDHTVKDTHSCTHHMVTSIHTLHNNFMLQIRYLLFNLVAAVIRYPINIQSQFFCCICNKLPFQPYFFCFNAKWVERHPSMHWKCRGKYPRSNLTPHLYRGTTQSLLQPYTEFLCCEHHPDTLTRPVIITFKWVRIYRNWILVPVNSLVWLTVTMFCTECYNTA